MAKSCTTWTSETAPRPGKKPGTANRRTVWAREILEKHGANPVEQLAKTMRDPKVPLELRIDCAKALLPYVLPRLAAVDITALVGHEHRHQHLHVEITQEMMADRKFRDALETVTIEHARLLPEPERLPQPVAPPLPEELRRLGINTLDLIENDDTERRDDEPTID